MVCGFGQARGAAPLIQNTIFYPILHRVLRCAILGYAVSGGVYGIGRCAVVGGIKLIVLEFYCKIASILDFRSPISFIICYAI